MEITDFSLQSEASQRDQIIVCADDVVLKNRLSQLKEQSVTRLDRNYSQRREEEFDSEIKRENGILDLVARLFRRRLNPNLRGDFVNLQIHRQKDEIASNQSTDSEKIILVDLFRFYNRFKDSSRVGRQRIAENVIRSSVEKKDVDDAFARALKRKIFRHSSKEVCP